MLNSEYGMLTKYLEYGLAMLLFCLSDLYIYYFKFRDSVA